jgi:hypothetical protein
MENPSRDDLIVIFFVLTEDFLLENPSQRPGKPPLIRDSELCAMAMMQCLYGEESEANFIRTHAPDIVRTFGTLPSLKEYNRRLREHEQLLGFLWRLMLELLEVEMVAKEGYIDTAPVPVTKHCRKPKGTFHPEATKGYCKSKDFWFYGYFLHLVVTPTGIPLQFTVLSADIDETKVLTKEFLAAIEGFLLGGDKGYILSDEQKRELLVTLIHPYRSNQRRKNTVEERAFLRGRGIIERVFSWLEEKLSLERTLAKTAAGVASRIWRKLLFFGFCIAFNSMLGNDLLQISRLW